MTRRSKAQWRSVGRRDKRQVEEILARSKEPGCGFEAKAENGELFVRPCQKTAAKFEADRARSVMQAAAEIEAEKLAIQKEVEGRDAKRVKERAKALTRHPTRDESMSVPIETKTGSDIPDATWEKLQKMRALHRDETDRTQRKTIVEDMRAMVEAESLPRRDLERRTRT